MTSRADPQPGARPGMPRLSMRGIRKAFAGTVAVAGVDLDVWPGDVCALVGHNGAGKSTLMAILAGAVRADAGEMHLDGQPYRPDSPLAARRVGVTMIFQELSLAPHLSVMENISLGVEPCRFGLVDRDRMRSVAAEALETLGHGQLDPDSRASSLSVAERQIVEIARALAAGCRVLVLDEPTSSLGPDDVEHLFALVERFKAQDRAIIYISHFIEEVTRIADRVVVLRDGRVAGSGAVHELRLADIVRLMVGAGVENLYPRSVRQPADPVLHVDPLVPGSQPLTLHRGEIVGIAGLVGAGRTRLLRTIFGLEPAAPGRIRVAAPRGMGMLSEDRTGEGLAVALSVADNVTLSRLSGLGPGPLVWPRRQRAAAATFMQRLDVRAEHPGQIVEELSGGNQQKVAFARLLHDDLDILILDEPTRGIDVGSKAQIYELIDRLVAPPESKAVLLVSSYLPELLGLCDRIAVMARGRLGAARPVSAWDEHALMMAATGAGDAA
jgi:ribose transport system ATP-binding protein